MTTSSLLSRLGCSVLAIGLASCATLKTPTLQVESLDLKRVRLTGAGVEVNFRVQNPNPEPILIERFEYSLKLNGRRLGRGYHSEAIRLDGFQDSRLHSRFALNFLSLPGAVRELVDDDRANVHVDGAFYVKSGDGLRKLKFSNGAKVDLGH